jgi:hypothetical protein
MAIEPLTNGIPPISTHERATDQESMQTGRSGESSHVSVRAGPLSLEY